MDFSDDYLAALEWNATYNNVHAGNILVFPMLESRLLENLSEELTSFTACRFLQEETSSTKLLTGGHDKFVSFNLTSFDLLTISFLDSTWTIFVPECKSKLFCSILTVITSFFSSVFSWVGKMISLLYLATA